MTRQITVFGATGSVGTSTLNLVREHPDKFSVFGLTAHQDTQKLAELVAEFSPRYAVISNPEMYGKARDALAELPADQMKTELLCGRDGLDELARLPVDLVIAAIVGLAGLSSVLAAVKAGQTIALANKESLVSAGHIVMPEARSHDATILPIDSEHNAIFQCLRSENPQNIRKIILTASGGPFRSYAQAELASVTAEQAVKHPNWQMGAKISVDSASLMNKGLELIEAFWLFDRPATDIDAVIHPQSVVHGMVGYCDGSWLSHMGVADMRVPISYALGYPERLSWSSPPFDISGQSLEFSAIDTDKFPCFAYAKSVIGTNPANAVILNAANEVAVAQFLKGRIGFMDIARLVGDALNLDWSENNLSTLDGITALDRRVRDHSLASLS